MLKKKIDKTKIKQKTNDNKTSNNHTFETMIITVTIVNITASVDLQGSSEIKSEEHTNRRQLNMTYNYEEKTMTLAFK